jgi:hypothetical protein
MDIFTRQDLDSLLTPGAQPCLSLFVPTQPGGGEQDRVLLKNLLDQAEQLLEHRGLRAVAARQFLAPVVQLTEDAAFRAGFAAGLALYASPEKMRSWRLPIPLVPQVIVGERCQVTPLVPLVNDARFFVLALSRNQVRLFEGTRFAVRQLEPKNLPASLEAALRFHEHHEPLLFHPHPTRGFGRWGALFHGHGSAIEDARDDLLHYFRAVDRGLHELLREQHCPLVLASVASLWPLYRQVNTYPHLLEEGLPGCPDQLSPEAIHRAAWPLVDRQLLMARAEALSQYARLCGTGRTAENLGHIVNAARIGGIETLFAERDRPCWGAVNCVAKGILCNKLRRPGDEDLVNVAVLHTLLHGGAVHLFDTEEVPRGRELPCAILRVSHAWAPTASPAAAAPSA